MRSSREAFRWVWRARAVGLGVLAWLLVLAAAWLRGPHFGLTEGLFLLAPTVIVPLGFRLLVSSGGLGGAGDPLRMAIRLQPFGAVLVAASFCLFPGWLAGLLSGPWLVVTALVGLSGLVWLWQVRFADPWRACQAAGMIFLPVGGLWLVASRLGLNPSGFVEPLVLLTGVHFHYAGFAAPLIAGATGAVLGSSPPFMIRLWRFAAIATVAGSPLLAAGFVISPLLRMIAASILATGLVALSMVTIHLIPRIRPPSAGALLGVSAASVILGMILVGAYAVGEFRGTLWIGIPQMARTHGPLNAIGFGLCGLIGWILVERASSEMTRDRSTEWGKGRASR